MATPLLIDDSEFEKALELIASYKLQLGKILEEKTNGNRKINIQNDIWDGTFNVLRNYYLQEYQIVLEKKDLSAMDVDLLASINYKKLQGYRNFGKVRLDHFKKLMVLHQVLAE